MSLTCCCFFANIYLSILAERTLTGIMCRTRIMRKSLFATLLSLGIPFEATLANNGDHLDGGAALPELLASSTVLDGWREYALASLKPNFSWASDEDLTAHAPSLFERGRAHFAPSSHFSSSAIDSTPIRVVLLNSKFGDTPLFVGADAPNLLPDYSPGFHRYLIAPSLTQHVGETSLVSVSVILAYQRIAGFGLDPQLSSAQDNDFSEAPLQNKESSFGSGVRVDFSQALNDRIAWQFGYQGRVNMDAFDGYRSFFAQPGTFDIPASTNLGLDFMLTPRLHLNAQAERVMYGAITPFVSSSLPPSLLAVLSSSLSPTFAWQNLDIYSMSWVWHDRDTGDISLRWSTREQPLPTSPLLRDALGAKPSSYNIELDYARTFGTDSILRFAATYAPTQYVFGTPFSYNLSSTLGSNQFQLEALWTTAF